MAQVPFEPYKVFDEQALPAGLCPEDVWQCLHRSTQRDKVSLWERTDPDLKQKGKNSQFLYQTFCRHKTSCASWDEVNF